MKPAQRFQTNAILYLKWINQHGLDGSAFSDDLRNFIRQARKQKQNSLGLLTGMDRDSILGTVKDSSRKSRFALYHFSPLRCLRFESSKWRIISGASADPISLLEKAGDLTGGGVILFEDFLGHFKDKVINQQLLERVKDLSSTSSASANLIFIFIESPKTSLRLPVDIKDSLIPLFTRLHSRLVDVPDEEGLFRRGKLSCVLPFLRAYLNTEGSWCPTWYASTWYELEGVKNGYTRFLRADQLLDWLKGLMPSDAQSEDLAVAINRLLTGWLVPVDEPLNERLNILERRVEAVRIQHTQLLRTRDIRDLDSLVARIKTKSGPVCAYLMKHLSPETRQALNNYSPSISHPRSLKLRKLLARDISLLLSDGRYLERGRTRRSAPKGAADFNRKNLEISFPDEITFRQYASLWSSNPKWGPRRPDIFPDAMRVNVAGLDPVHTPENERAGLTRYLSLGWYIDDSGSLAFDRAKKSWGPSTFSIPNRLHNEPRRLMLGASLLPRAVDIQESSDTPKARVRDAKWNPPGKNMFAVFSTLNGWTHEDAIVLSESASEKLRRWYLLNWHVLIPTIASRIDLTKFQLGRGGTSSLVKEGTTLVRAFIDLFAIGLDEHDAEELGRSLRSITENAWLEIGLPKAKMPIDGKILEVQRQNIVDFFNSEEPNAINSMALKNFLVNDTARWKEIITFVLEISTRASIGDKLATRHGIKGVVSRILDDDHESLPQIGGRRAEIVLSPLGIARRGAMGQFREASGTTCEHCTDDTRSARKRSHGPHNGDEEVAEPTTADGGQLPRHGTVFVTRQPQDSFWRCKVRGREPHNEVRGQRYGEMEFWALMSHGAVKIADELLSPARSASRWMQWEAKISPAKNHRGLATQAINRFLATINAHIDGGHLLEGASPASFTITIEKPGDLNYATDLLEDAERFADSGGMGVIELKRPVNITIRNIVGLPEVGRVYVLPPWLRPMSPGGEHKLTAIYRALFRVLANPLRGAELPSLVHRYLDLVLDTDYGVHAFLRREVLGRRLTRSARAVIVPRPDLRIDQVMIPQYVAIKLFEGLPDENKRVVLINRNPTLHRLGIFALRPVPLETDAPVFGLPLGILKVLGADFDGDQATLVALETPEALKEAERLLPGATKALRQDPFRVDMPAFPLLQEFSDLRKEQELAAVVDEVTQEDWCELHRRLLNKLIKEEGAGWNRRLMTEYEEDNRDLWDGLEEDEWLSRAQAKMEYIYSAVRRKGRFGGVLRRELYRQPFKNEDTFWETTAALQAVTERLVQSTLTTKTGEGAAKFNAKKYFAEPSSEASREALKDLELKNLSPLLNLGEIKDPAQLLNRIQGSEDSLSSWLKSQPWFAELDDYIQRSSSNPDEVPIWKGLATGLNTLIMNADLYRDHLDAVPDEEQVKLADDYAAGGNIAMVNRKVLEALYRPHIVPKPSSLNFKKLSEVLDRRRAPQGLLRWLSQPNTKSLLNSFELSIKPIADPRIKWFLG